MNWKGNAVVGACRAKIMAVQFQYGTEEKGKRDSIAVLSFVFPFNVLFVRGQ